MPRNDDMIPPPEKPHGLSFIAPKDSARAIAARDSRYTRLVTWLRVALPVAAAMVILILFVWPMVSTRAIKTAVMKNIPDLVIDNLHYTGLDTQNQPYSVSALKATRVIQGHEIYDLDHPEGEIALSSGAWVSGKAEQGRLDEAQHQLWLGGNVHLFHDGGFEFTSDEAQVDMQNRNAWGDKPVFVQGNFGSITGKGFQLYNSGSTIVIKGPAKAILTPHTKPDLHPDDGSVKPSDDKPAH